MFIHLDRQKNILTTKYTVIPCVISGAGKNNYQPALLPQGKQSSEIKKIVMATVMTQI